jgi:acetylornithine deacetylase/succinyl-diaminopimelate desuccinylase-like protein
MPFTDLDAKARALIGADTDLVCRHLGHLEKMVATDSRSFNVNEYPGDRAEPTDMREILALAEDYLRGIGFPLVRINRPQELGAPPILMAEIPAGVGKPVILLYAHLDKQPYMDNEKFEKWNGTPPWVLRWNGDRSRAYGRGAADDLSGVVAIGLAVDAVLRASGIDTSPGQTPDFSRLPCSLKIIYETEEESGSYTLIDQIMQNRDFFAPADCVIITDVVNPATGVPGLTISLRGIIQLRVAAKDERQGRGMDAQTALYKMLASLVREDHSLAVEGIAQSDVKVTDSERQGYARVPITVEVLKNMAGMLPGVKSTTAENKVNLLVAQLRTSYANVRPGHRVAGGVVFGAAGCRFEFAPASGATANDVLQRLDSVLRPINPFNLKIHLRPAVGEGGRAAVDVVVQSAMKDPHSGVNGGPFPIPEIQLARMVDRLVENDGNFTDARLRGLVAKQSGRPALRLRSLLADHDGKGQPFDDPSANAMVEIRLAPGNEEGRAQELLQAHLRRFAPTGFDWELTPDKDGSPWMTGIDHPAFAAMLESLRAGYGKAPCLYGCGGSIPFVAKLMQALGDIPPFCLGAYDPESQVHEPNESLSMADLLGCARSIVTFITRSQEAFPHPKSAPAQS